MNGFHFFQNIYKMESTPRGLALVIDNESFDPGVGDRHGTEEDAEALRNLLIDLDFEIQMKRNCSAEVSLSFWGFFKS